MRYISNVLPPTLDLGYMYIITNAGAIPTTLSFPVVIVQ